MLLTLALATPAAAAQIAPHELRTVTYRSPSGEYTLWVNPSDRDGAGAADYKLSRRGNEVWQGTRPFTLFDAVVGDDGQAAGYAYGGGCCNFGRRGTRPVLEGDAGGFRIAQFGAQGSVKLDISTPRTGFVSCIGPGPDPDARRVVLDLDNDRWLVSVLYDADFARGVDESMERGETWQVYRWSTGEALGKWHPWPAMDRGTFTGTSDSIAALPGTPLLLSDWLLWMGGVKGVRFALHDGNGACVWKLDWPDDRSKSHLTTDKRKKLDEWVDDKGSVVAVTRPGRFSVYSVKAFEMVTFEARRENGRWVVKEVGREPARLPAERAASAFFEESQKDLTDRFAKIPTVELRSLGDVELKSQGLAPGPVHDVRDFVPFADGSVAFLRDEADARASLVLVDSQGKLVRESFLPEFPEDGLFGWTSLTRLSESELILFQDLGKGSATFRYDVKTHRLTEACRNEFRGNVSVAALDDGAFVLWDQERLRLRDAKNVELWNVKPNVDLSFGNRLAVTQDGRIAALSFGGEKLVYYDREGERVGEGDIRGVFERDANRYATELQSDVSGGLFFNNPTSASPVIRVGLDGTVLGRAVPRFGNGAPLLGPVKLSSSGHLYATDGQALYRLQLDGKADRTLGHPPAGEILVTVGALAVGFEGIIAALDGHDGSIHAFDAAGAPRFGVALDAASVARGLRVSKEGLHFGAGGEVCALLESVRGRTAPTIEPSQQVNIQPDGKGESVVARLGDFTNGRIAANRGSEYAWVSTYHALVKLDSAGTELARIEKTPEHEWIGSQGEFGVDSAGAVVLCPERSRASGSENRANVVPSASTSKLCLYGADGAPTRSILTCFESCYDSPIALDAGKIVVSTGEELVIVNSDGSGMARFRPPQTVGRRTTWHPYLVHGGTELWLYDAGVKPKTVLRYAMP